MKIKVFFTNNSRKRNHIPLYRKKDKGKRYYTRRKFWEDFCAWYDAMNDRWTEEKNEEREII